METSSKSRIRFLTLTVSALLLAAIPTAWSAELHVPSEYATIQAAIDAADPDDEVIVADGTYSGTGFRNINFSGKAITVCSANGASTCTLDCSGTDTEMRRGFLFSSGEGPDSILEGITISNGLSYQNYGGGIYISNSSPTIRDCVIENCQSPFAGGGMSLESNSNPAITNCTIQNNTGGGINLHSSSPYIENCQIINNQSGGGAGISAYLGTPTIKDCTITGNQTTVVGGEAGGGINCYDCDALIVNCTISDNLSTYGGGIASLYSEPEIQQCTLNRNTANYYGGAITCIGGDPNISNCSLSDNTAAFGGGAVDLDNSNATIRSCTFTGNACPNGGGGGINCRSQASPLITSCTLIDNQAFTGGGILVYSLCSPVIRDCTLTGNSCINNGGGMALAGEYPQVWNCILHSNVAGVLGGGILCSEGDTLVQNCLITGNQATYGGGLCVSGGEETNVTNCTISGNRAEETSGGVHVIYDADLELTNCILTENEAVTSTDELLVLDGDGGVNYCNIRHNSTEVNIENTSNIFTWGSGNLDADPQFQSPGYWDDNQTPGDRSDDVWMSGDYRLQNISPCVDAADGDEASSTDLEGNSRYDDMDTPNVGSGVMNYTDMGAYEFQGASVSDTGTLSIVTSPVSGEIFVDDITWGTAPQTRVVDVGQYTVRFGEVTDYVTPLDQNVTVLKDQTTSVTGIYVIETGTLSISTSPFNAEVFVDGFSWGITPVVQQIAVGQHTIAFSDVIDYVTPVDQAIVVHRDQTTSVTGTYVLETIIDNITIEKLTVKAGKTRDAEADSFSFKGTFTDTEADDFTSADMVTVRVGSYEETILVDDFKQKGKKPKYSYKGGKVGITSVKLDFTKKTFSISGKNVDLSGLAAPISVEIDFGNLVGLGLAQDAGEGDVINSKKSLPMQLLSGNTDGLRVEKVVCKQGKANNVGNLVISGSIATEDDIDLQTASLLLHWGISDHAVGLGDFELKGKTKNQYKKKPDDLDPANIMISIDLMKCTFQILAKNTTWLWEDSSVTFGLEFGTFNETEEVTF